MQLSISADMREQSPLDWLNSAVLALAHAGVDPSAIGAAIACALADAVDLFNGRCAIASQDATLENLFGVARTQLAATQKDNLKGKLHS